MGEEVVRSVPLNLFLEQGLDSYAALWLFILVCIRRNLGIE